MESLNDFKENIHKCSKCGICQGQCPVYQITGNDCSVSRGFFIMLRGYLKGELKLTKTIKRYLDLCLKCGKCSDNCPSGVDVVDIIASAKAEYFKKCFFEKCTSVIQKYFIFGFVPNFFSIFNKPRKSQVFDKKVLYFGGCGSKFKSDKSVVKILNNIGVEVVNPVFDCCGISLFARGDLANFKSAIKSYISILRKFDIDEVVTTCSSCEKTLKSYLKWANEEEIKYLSNIKVKNIYEYLRENEIRLKFKTTLKVTYHKPCSLSNFCDVKWVLENTNNLEYIEMIDYENCCGLNGLLNFKEYKILNKIYKLKRKAILETSSKCVLTSCLGCEIALKSYSFGQYNVQDLLDCLAENI